jgi:LPS sulfotransferase NodH
MRQCDVRRKLLETTGNFRRQGGRFYIICFSIRSGSSLLCEDLAKAGLGQPAEFFQPESSFPTQEYLGYRADSLADYLSQLLAGSSNGVFGYKINWLQACALKQNLFEQAGVETDLCFAELFPGALMIHSRRRDKLLQAISAWRAAKTNEWHRLAGARTGAPNPVPDYSYEELRTQLLHALSEDWLWKTTLECHQGPHAEVVYEDYIPHRVEVVRRLAERLDVRLPQDYTPSEVLLEMKDKSSYQVKEMLANDLRKFSRPLWIDPEARSKTLIF